MWSVTFLSFGRIACVKDDVNENLVQEEVKAKVSYVQKARGGCAPKRVTQCQVQGHVTYQNKLPHRTHLHHDHRPMTPIKSVTLNAHVVRVEFET